MTKNLLPALLVLVALYVAYCSGAAQGKRTGRAQQADSVAAVIRDSNARYAQRFVVRELERDRLLAGLSADLQRLRGRAIPRDTLVKLITDTLALEQIAVRDSVIAQQDTQLTIYRAMVVDRDSLLALKDRQIAALETARNAWKKAAASRVRFKPCAAAILGTKGADVGVGICVTI